MSKLYTAVATATGGRNGKVESSDGVLNLEVRIPKEMGGSGGAFTNPEQLFAAGYAACFDSALNFVAMQQKTKITSSVTADVGIGPNDSGGFALAVKLRARKSQASSATSLNSFWKRLTRCALIPTPLAAMFPSRSN
jgi:Ohr subfamily peroxiredoxin